MSDTNMEQDPTTQYQARIMLAALTKCKDQEQAAQLLAQYLALAPRIAKVIDQAVELTDKKEHRQAIALLDEMINRAEQFSSPYPTEAVREVFGYDMARLYFMRATAQFGGSSRSADPAADLNAALTDLNRAQRYPESCFGELNPELPAKMVEFRSIVAMLKGQGAALGIEGRYQAAFERLKTQMAEDDYPGAIRSATECISIVEELFRDYAEAFAVNPKATTDYQGDLVTHYGTRGGMRLDYAHAGGPDPETLIKLAEADIDKALSFPPACYRDPGVRPSLLKAKKQIQEMKSSGGVSAAKPTGCLVLVAACGFAGLLGVILA